MKVANITNQPAPPPPNTVEGAAGGEAAKLQFIAESENEEFMLFRETHGKIWAFPRAHLVSSQMKDRTVCEFNFRTHLVTFGGNDCTRIYRPLLDLEVCAVIVAKWPEPPLHVRTVGWLKVEENDIETKESKP